MRHFENGSELRPAHARARHHRRAEVSGAAAAARQMRAGGRYKLHEDLPHRPRQGPSARRLDSADLTQPIGRAQRRPPGEAAGSRDLPGLMQPGRAADGHAAPPASLHALSTWRMPASRRPLNGEVAGGGLPGIRDGRRAQASQPYRKVADGLAIAPKVSVVLPVMNEAANLPGVFDSLPAWVHEVVLVDGRSTDGTIDVARRLRPDVRVVYQGGAGKGDALAAGFAAATGEIVVAIDGDGSTDGREIVRFVSALLTGADFAKGSRFGSAGASDDITLIRRYGNKMLNLAVNRLFGTSFSDLCYGYTAIWAHHLDRLHLDSPGFEIETLMSIRAAQAGLKIHEVPSHERLRQHGASNLSAIKDGWRVLRLITQERRDVRRRKARRPRPFMAPGIVINCDAQEQSHGDGFSGREVSGLFDGLSRGPDGQAQR
ncbi:MAG TPA: glycosyltransferase family 2 protein [Streptosporangiaceae bacterium]|nr:glycosyltransferase family 2 protein [Streptosporangiaceae bacterium]